MESNFTIKIPDWEGGVIIKLSLLYVCVTCTLIGCNQLDELVSLQYKLDNAQEQFNSKKISDVVSYMYVCLMGVCKPGCEPSPKAP